MTGFAGKVALVTGAASGIGRATALAFARAGASVALADRDEDGARAVAEAITEEGGQACAIRADVAEFADCEAMVAEAVHRFGRLDIAVNNAGIPSDIGGRFEDIKVADWDLIIAVNLSGVFLSMKAEVPALRAAGGGAIVNTASVASLVAARGMAGYVAAKHGVAGLTKAAALDLIDANIRVNAVCPGFVRTGMTEGLLAHPDMAAQLAALAPIGRIAEADEVARTILFLASDAAAYCVGVMMPVDGGVTLQ